MSLNNFALSTVNRLPNILSASGHQVGVQRATASAERLSRRNVESARAALMHNAVVRAVGLVYDVYPDSRLLCNVDADLRILVPVPWSSKNYRTYGLRRTEADALRWEMLNRCQPENVDPALFVWMSDYRAWYLNLHAYPSQADAAEYVKLHPVTWRTISGWRQSRT